MKKKPFLSIIIPAYDASDTLPALLNSIYTSKGVSKSTFEVIVVDDASPQSLKEVVVKHHAFYFRLKENLGPARARNFGVEKARGEVVLFHDCDVVLYPNTLKYIIDSFKNESSLCALTGVWDKKQKTSAFFPNFKALRDWNYWINERDRDGLYFIFSTRIAAIRKKIFQEVGGFDTKYKGPDIEDIEITYRIAEKYPIRFDEKARVHHEFGGFWGIAKGYFRRSYLWVPVFLKRRKFDHIATTGQETFTGMVPVVNLFSLILSVFFPGFLWLVSATFLLYLYLQRRFFRFVFSEKGFWFMVGSILTSYILYLIIYAGAGWYVIKNPLEVAKEVLPR